MLHKINSFSQGKGSFSINKILPVFILLGVIMLITPVAKATDNPSNNGKVYMIVVDKMSIFDISADHTPTMFQLSREGAVGLISNRTLRGRNTMDTSLSMGSGNIGRVFNNGIMGFNQEETVPDRGQTAGSLYHNLTGINPGNSAVLLVNLPEISAGIMKEHVTTLPGAMGEVLGNNGFAVCVLGNGDTDSEYSRASVVIGMDAEGKVPLGDVGLKTIINTDASYLSRETNYDYLIEQVDLNRQAADVMIVELSDLARLEVADTAFDHILNKEKITRLAHIDQFINDIRESMNPQSDLMVIVSPSPAKLDIAEKNTFTPLLLYGKGVGNGYLTSGSTRRDYVVANTDIAPSILSFFGLRDDTGTMIGRQIVSEQEINSENLQRAQELSGRTSTVNRLRVPLVKGYVVFQIIIILLALAAIFWLAEWRRILEPAMVSLVTVPLVYLCLGYSRLPGDWQYIILAIFMAIALTWLIMRIAHGNAVRAFFIMAVVTVLAVNLDLLTGSNLIQSSVLGYDPMAGARYYGVGNEFMGILLGSSIAAAAIAYQRYPNRLLLLVIALFFILQCYLIASPSWGANSDGMLTAPIAFLVTLFLLGDFKLRWKSVGAIIGITLLATMAFTYYDMIRAPELQTHLGRAANQIAAGGLNEGLTIIARKLAMNLKLIRYTIWSWVFIVILLVMSLLVYRPVGAMMRLRQEKPYIVKGFGGIIAGALVGLVINDSGIVAASTTSIYLVVIMILLMLKQQRKSLIED
ncbi:MAG: hypothetical protein PHD40_05940 [Syntrophomonadaceae bacterium]|nr:hypothetical protein [Syntrophomonadaceae bacterium]